MKRSQAHLPSLFASVTFLLGALLLFGIGLLMGVAALSALLAGSQVQAQQPIFLVAFSFEALILFVAAVIVFQKFLERASADKQVTIPMPVWLVIGLLLVAAVTFGIGYFLEDNRSANWLVLPFLTVPAVVLPLAVLFGLGARRLPLSTRWQTWSILGLAMTAAPFLLFVMEIAVAAVIFVGFIVYIMTQPELAAQMQRLSQQMMILGPQSEAARELISPYLMNPAVMAIALLYISVIVPAIEEILKPLGVWLFARTLSSPAQGFTLGALSGAGYALIETIGISGQQSSEWASLLGSRIGTGLLHITTSALMGTAIVLAVREGRYLRLFGTYLLAVFLHGLWNALAVVFTFSTLAEFLKQPGRLGTLQPAMMVSMVILAMGLFAILILSNRKWRKYLAPPVVEPPLAPALAETFVTSRPLDSEMNADEITVDETIVHRTGNDETIISKPTDTSEPENPNPS